MTEDADAAPEAVAWSVARTHRQKEALALRELRRQEFAALCPMLLKTVRRNRRFEERRAPLFPGYVFVGIEPGGRSLRPVNGTRGVRHLLTDGEGRPARLPPGFVAFLARQMGDDGVVAFRPWLVPGGAVRVNSGPFAALLGRVEALDGQGRVRVLLQLMAREVRVSLPADCLQMAG